MSLSYTKATFFKNNVNEVPLPAELKGVTLKEVKESTPLVLFQKIESLNGTKAAEDFMGFKSDGSFVKPTGLTPTAEAAYDDLYKDKKLSFDGKGGAAVIDDPKVVKDPKVITPIEGGPR